MATTKRKTKTQKNDAAIRRQFKLGPYTDIVLPGVVGGKRVFFLTLRRLTYEQTVSLLRHARKVGVQLRERRD